MSSQRIRIVLVNPTHPGNIGAAARAMKNMGLRRLYLVAPKTFPSAEATARASGADDVLAATRVCGTLAEAVDDCTLVIGASARPRRIAWPQLDAREAAATAAAEQARGEVAVVFGREHSGLTNDELSRCHYLLHIPCSSAYPSLNLAAAVQVVAYELFLAERGIGEAGFEKAPAPATAAEMELYFEHLERALMACGFLDPANPRQLMYRLRRLYARARPDQNEINILRGILTAFEEWGRGGKGAGSGG